MCRVIKKGGAAKRLVPFPSRERSSVAYQDNYVGSGSQNLSEARKGRAPHNFHETKLANKGNCT